MIYTQEEIKQSNRYANNSTTQQFNHQAQIRSVVRGEGSGKNTQRFAEDTKQILDLWEKSFNFLEEIMSAYFGKSFGELVDSGTSKEEIMTRFSMNEMEYEKLLTSLHDIRARKRNK